MGTIPHLSHPLGFALQHFGFPTMLCKIVWMLCTKSCVLYLRAVFAAVVLVSLGGSTGFKLLSALRTNIHIKKTGRFTYTRSEAASLTLRAMRRCTARRSAHILAAQIEPVAVHVLDPCPSAIRQAIRQAIRDAFLRVQRVARRLQTLGLHRATHCVRLVRDFHGFFLLPVGLSAVPPTLAFTPRPRRGGSRDALHGDYAQTILSQSATYSRTAFIVRGPS